MDIEFYSHYLQRNVSFSAIVPVDDRTQDNSESRAHGDFATLYLLNGLHGHHRDWLNFSKLAFWARGRNVAIIMPSAENKSYVDNPHTLDRYGEFIGKELVKFSRGLLPLSHKREKTAIGGLSMGGYGAMRNGLKYHETFGAIATLSGAIAAEILLKITEEDPRFAPRKSFFEGVFGSLDAIPGSDMDCSALLKKLIASGADVPKIYMSCGTEDELLWQSRLYHKIFSEANVPHKYVEEPGGHDWLFWDKQIADVLDWFGY